MDFTFLYFITSSTTFKAVLVGVFFTVSYFLITLLISSGNKAIFSYKNSKPNNRILKFLNISQEEKQQLHISKNTFSKNAIKTSFSSKVMIAIKNSKFGHKISNQGVSIIFYEYISPLFFSILFFIPAQHHFNIMPKFVLFLIIFISIFSIQHVIIQKKESIRHRKFLQHFPHTIDSFKRSLKAGFTIAKSIEIAAKDSSFKPIENLFAEIHEKINLGMSVQEAVKIISEKTEIEEFKFFAITLSTYSTAGGNIVDILSNLAQIIRKRSQLSLKVRALSSEARMTGYILLSIPFLIAGIIHFINPGHLLVFFSSYQGKTLLLITLIMFITGTVLMFKITNIKV